MNAFDSFLSRCASDCVNARHGEPRESPETVLLRACTDLDMLTAGLQALATRPGPDPVPAQAVLLQIRDRAARAMREYEAAR